MERRSSEADRRRDARIHPRYIILFIHFAPLFLLSFVFFFFKPPLHFKTPQTVALPPYIVLFPGSIRVGRYGCTEVPEIPTFQVHVCLSLKGRENLFFLFHRHFILFILFILFIFYDKPISLLCGDSLLLLHHRLSENGDG